MPIEALLRVARGDCAADLLLTNAHIVNLSSSEIFPGSVAIHEGRFVGFGKYQADKTIDLQGAYVAPGFIDGHVHLESSLLAPGEFARAVLPRGTTCVVADPHEIVNVMGAEGLAYMLAETEHLPLEVYFMLPSCVPATHLETAGATFGAEEMRSWIEHPRVLGIGELMNFPGVVHSDPEVLAKIALAGSRRIDGHAPLVMGRDLDAYTAAGITSDHETSRPDEAVAKLRRGMFLLMRDGSAARNLLDLLPIVTDQNARFIGFATDDRHPDFMVRHGHIDDMVRQAIAFGIDPVLALQMASYNTADHYRLDHLGAIAPGRQADFVIIEDLEQLEVREVFKKGRRIARAGKLIEDIPAVRTNPGNSVRIQEPADLDLAVPARDSSVRVIDLVPHQILTEMRIVTPRIEHQRIVSDPAEDILKIVVVERHHARPQTGIGFVHGFGLQKGALATTVAHDSHNLIVIGVSDEDIRQAIAAVRELQGGQLVLADGQVRASLPLPIAGLMSTESLHVVNDATEALNRVAAELGCELPAPFMSLSFLALPVVPKLRITDQGLVDVDEFRFVSLFAED